MRVLLRPAIILILILGIIMTSVSSSTQGVPGFNIPEIIFEGETTLTPTNTGAPLYTVAAGGYTTTVSFNNPTNTLPTVIAYFSFPFVLTSGSYTVYTGKQQILPYIATSSSTRFSSTFFGITETQITFYYNQYTSVDFEVSPEIVFHYIIYGSRSTR